MTPLGLTSYNIWGEFMNLIFLVLALLIADALFLFIIYKCAGWGIYLRRDEAIRLLIDLPERTYVRMMIGGDFYDREGNP